jgi:zinc protease
MSIPGPNDIARYELPNGIVVLARENDASPAVVVRGYVRVGAYDEKPEQAGLAAFTADGLMRGTEHRSFEDIYETVEAVGASVSVSGGMHTTAFGTKSLAEDLPLALDVLADVLRYPVFPADEVEKLRGEILTDLAERVHDTRRMANLTFQELAYPDGHPYGYSLSGYPETIRGLSRDDLVDFYNGGYGAQGMVIVVVGAVAPEDVRQQIEDIFGDWEGQRYDRDPLPEVPPIAKVRERYLPIPDKTQADIVLGYPGPARAAPDYLDARLCNTVLGVFGLMGRLGENVRDEQGLAYYATSRLSGGEGPGPWRVIAGVNPVNVEQAVVSIRDEIRRICEEPVGEEELVDNKAFITGSMPLHLETNEGVAGTILSMERHGLGLDYLQRYADMIDEITAARVQAAAQRWLDPDAYALAIAGPPPSSTP